MAANDVIGPRVSEDQLEFDEDIRCLDGKPFTGIGCEYFPDSTLKSETPYKDGWVHGLAKEWYPGGQLLSECHCRRGVKFGRYREWHPNGELKIDANYELGIELEYLEWDEGGELKKQRKLDPDSPNSNYKSLQKLRSVYVPED